MIPPQVQRSDNDLAVVIPKPKFFEYDNMGLRGKAGGNGKAGKKGKKAGKRPSKLGSSLEVSGANPWKNESGGDAGTTKTTMSTITAHT